MKYRMIALDLDGTLNNDEKVITPRTHDALMAVQEQGVIVALVYIGVAGSQEMNCISFLPTPLTLTEAALLAGIPQSPTYNDPLQYPEHALERLPQEAPIIVVRCNDGEFHFPISTAIASRRNSRRKPN